MMNATYINIDECYGDRVTVELADYIEQNPDGKFEVRADGIYELVYDGELWQQVAMNARYALPTQKAANDAKGS
jgi:hypothetical protein